MLIAMRILLIGIVMILLHSHTTNEALARHPKKVPLLILPCGTDSALAEEIMFYARQLGIGSSAVIRVDYSLRMAHDKAGLIQYQNSGIGPSPHQLLIYLNKKSSRSEHSMTIAHEMVHAAQYIHGDLIMVSLREFIWKGEVYRNILRIRYEARPWEIEAIELGEELRQRYLANLVPELRPL